MTKQQYLDALLNKSHIQKMGTPIEQTSLSDDELQLKVYVVKLLENVNSSKAYPVSHKFAVYKEGLAGETAFAAQEYKPFFVENDNAYMVVKSYIESVPGIKAYWIKEWDKDQNYAKVRVFQDVNETIEEKWLLVWNEPSIGITHREITKTIG